MSHCVLTQQASSKSDLAETQCHETVDASHTHTPNPFVQRLCVTRVLLAVHETAATNAVQQNGQGRTEPGQLHCAVALQACRDIRQSPAGRNRNSI